MIEDNLTGAYLLSIIDFFLSFLIIGGLGVVLWLLPLINHFGKVDETALKHGGH